MDSSPPMLFFIPFVIIAQVHAQITPSMEKTMRVGCVPLAIQCGFDISGLATGVSIDTIMDDNGKSFWPCMCLGKASAFSMNKCMRAIEDTGLYAGSIWSIPDVTDELVDETCEWLGTPRTKRPGPPTPSPTLSPTPSDDVLWYILGAVGGALVVIALFAICWRRCRPPPRNDNISTEMTSL